MLTVPRFSVYCHVSGDGWFGIFVLDSCSCVRLSGLWPAFWPCYQGMADYSQVPTPPFRYICFERKTGSRNQIKKLSHRSHFRLAVHRPRLRVLCWSSRSLLRWPEKVATRRHIHSAPRASWRYPPVHPLKAELSRKVPGSISDGHVYRQHISHGRGGGFICRSKDGLSHRFDHYGVQRHDRN